MKKDQKDADVFALKIEAYYNIFNNMNEIMVIFEIIRNKNGKPSDMIIRDVNEVYLSNFHISREKVTNELASQIYGQEFVDYYFKLARENADLRKGQKFETYFFPLNKFYLTTLFPIGKNLYVTLGIDITERKRMEMALGNNVHSRPNKPFERIIYDIDGNEKIIQSTIFPIKSKKDMMIGSIARDIIYQKEIEKKLEEARINLEKKVHDQTRELIEANKSLLEQKGKFQEIFNKANDMISLNEMIDCFPGKFIEINDIGVQRLGYSKKKLLGMSPKDIVAPDKHFQMPENAAKPLGRPHRFEIVHVAEDGKRIPVEVNNHLINYMGRKVCLAISRDISERKKAEEDQKKLIAELKRSNDELQKYGHAISHDLQEPLRTIASFTQLLERRYKGKLDEDADEFINYIVDASIRMKQMIKDLLEYSKVSSEAREFTKIKSEELIKNVLNDLKVKIESSNTDITYDPLPDVFGDSKQLQRVFQNLITNAIKFRKPETPPKIHITVKEDAENNEYIFSIKDNGIGIEKQYMERIFELFQRLHTIDEYNGSGIGLPISKKIVKRHGGRIWVESEYGQVQRSILPFLK